MHFSILISIATVDYRANYGYNIVAKNRHDPITIEMQIEKNSYRRAGTIIVDLVHWGDRWVRKHVTIISVAFLARRQRPTSIGRHYHAEISRGWFRPLNQKWSIERPNGDRLKGYFLNNDLCDDSNQPYGGDRKIQAARKWTIHVKYMIEVHK